MDRIQPRLNKESVSIEAMSSTKRNQDGLQHRRPISSNNKKNNSYDVAYGDGTDIDLAGGDMKERTKFMESNSNNNKTENESNNGNTNRIMLVVIILTFSIIFNVAMYWNL